MKAWRLLNGLQSGCKVAKTCPNITILQSFYRSPSIGFLSLWPPDCCHFARIFACVLLPEIQAQVMVPETPFPVLDFSVPILEWWAVLIEAPICLGALPSFPAACGLPTPSPSSIDKTLSTADYTFPEGWVIQAYHHVFGTKSSSPGIYISPVYFLLTIFPQVKGEDKVRFLGPSWHGLGSVSCLSGSLASMAPLCKLEKSALLPGREDLMEWEAESWLSSLLVARCPAVGHMPLHGSWDSVNL